MKERLFFSDPLECAPFGRLHPGAVFAEYGHFLAVEAVVSSYIIFADASYIRADVEICLVYIAEFI